MKESIKKESSKKEKPKYSMWQNSAYILSYAWKKDKIVLFVILAQIFLTVAVSTIEIFLPKAVVEQILTGSPLMSLVVTVLGFTLALVLLNAAKTYYDSTTQPRRTGIRLQVCIDILHKAMQTDYINLERKKFNDLKEKAHRMTGGNNDSTEEVYNCYSKLGTSILGFVVYMVLLVAVNPLVLLIAVATTVIGAEMKRRANKWQYDHDEDFSSYGKRLWYINNVGSKFEMAKDIRLFNMAGWLSDVYNAYMKLTFDLRRKAQTKQLIADIVNCFAEFIRTGICYAYLIWLVLYGNLSIDGFVLLFAAIGGFSQWIMGIMQELTDLNKHSLEYCRLREYLEYPDGFKREDGEFIEHEAGKGYDIELKNVSFKYEGSDEPTLENINLKIKAGEKLAIVGLNGAGKTTLVKLMCGLYDPTNGTVLLNGRDIREYNRKQYYSLFTAVFQEFNILPLSIADNISQLTDNDVDMERVKLCLTQADLLEKMMSLPNGLDTLLIKDVNDDAAELSGGETQKLMLARALYKNSPLLILDEPTAALDPIAESNMYEKYNELSAGKTSVYISHRLASTRFCDRIIMIGSKAIIEQGTHDELMKLGGKYAEMFEIQSKYYKDGKEHIA